MIKTNIELANKVKEIATKYKTLYVMGCFGAPLKDEYKDRYCNNYDYNKQPARTAMIKAASADTFGFDCVCLIKGVLWGWNGNKNDVYGGAKYCSNAVPDYDADIMFNQCAGKSSDFSNIEIGEAVWMDGHIGVYIGDGLAVECTPKWENNVQITAVGNIGTKKGYNTRTWTKHGKLPYISYVAASAPKPAPSPAPDKNETLLPIGSVVKFTGNMQYGASTSNKGVSAKAGTVKITSRAAGTPHPYHAISTDNSGVYGWVNASDIDCSAAPSKPSKSEIKVDDIVQFRGGNVYVSANAHTSAAIKGASRCKVTIKHAGGKHPYHLISEDGKGVYGWVDKSSIE